MNYSEFLKVLYHNNDLLLDLDLNNPIGNIDIDELFTGSNNIILHIHLYEGYTFKDISLFKS